MPHILSIVLGLVLSLYLAVLGALAAFQRRLIYPGAFSGHGSRAARPAPPGTSAIAVETADGERLLGYWRAPKAGCGIVLTFHGNGSRPEPHAARFITGPWAGWGVLALAYRGYPGSTGTPSEAGLIADGVAAYRAVAERAPGAPVLLHGHSLGAAVAIAVAAQTAPLGLYLEAPFDSLAHLVALRFPFVPRRLLRDRYRSDLRIGRSTTPVFIVHGTEDPVIPIVLAARLATEAGPRTRFAAIPGDHISILGNRDAEARRLFGAGIGCARPESMALP